MEKQVRKEYNEKLERLNNLLNEVRDLAIELKDETHKMSHKTLKKVTELVKQSAPDKDITATMYVGQELKGQEVVLDAIQHFANQYMFEMIEVDSEDIKDL